MKTLLLIATSFLVIGTAAAQPFGSVPVNSGRILEAVTVRENIPTKRMSAYESVREADLV